MATQKGGGLVSRAVREALGTLVSPQICEQLITRSLAAHGLNNIPETGVELGQWLEGSLRAEVETAVGPDAADLMMMQLGPIAAYAAVSQPKGPQLAAAPVPPPARRISTPPPPEWPDSFDEEPDRPTNLRLDPGLEPNWEREPDRTRELPKDPFSDSGPPTGTFAEVPLTPREPANANIGSDEPSMELRTLPPAKAASDSPRQNMFTARPQAMDKVVSDAPTALPIVLTATNDTDDLEALRHYLSGTASVIHVPDLVGLLDALEDTTLVEPIVLIDCQRPTVHITSVAAIGEDLPRGTTVVLWGADDSTWQQIDRDRSPSCRWVRCSAEATTDDVGSLCSMLIG